MSQIISSILTKVNSIDRTQVLTGLGVIGLSHVITGMYMYQGGLYSIEQYQFALYDLVRRTQDNDFQGYEESLEIVIALSQHPSRHVYSKTLAEDTQLLSGMLTAMSSAYIGETIDFQLPLNYTQSTSIHGQITDISLYLARVMDVMIQYGNPSAFPIELMLLVIDRKLIEPSIIVELTVSLARRAIQDVNMAYILFGNYGLEVLERVLKLESGWRTKEMLQDVIEAQYVMTTAFVEGAKKFYIFNQRLELIQKNPNLVKLIDKYNITKWDIFKLRIKRFFRNDIRPKRFVYCTNSIFHLVAYKMGWISSGSIMWYAFLSELNSIGHTLFTNSYNVFVDYMLFTYKIVLTIGTLHWIIKKDLRCIIPLVACEFSYYVTIPTQMYDDVYSTLLYGREKPEYRNYVAKLSKGSSTYYKVYSNGQVINGV